MIQTPYEIAQATQRLAAEPHGSRLVSANAGSGKTKVLVDRVSRLLWAGVEPDRILCLTYTKAAAGEMQTRLFRTLGNWSVLPTEALTKKLNDLSGSQHSFSPERLRDARKLFAKALEAPEGLKVQTIHAFCDRVLSRFPVEAGLLPGFAAMDENDQRALRADTQALLMAQAAQNSELHAALLALGGMYADMNMPQLFDFMAGAGRRLVQSGSLSQVAETLDIAEDLTQADVYADAWPGDLREQARDMAQALMTSANVNDRAKAETVLNALIDPDPAVGFARYAEIFLTQKGTLRAQAVTLKAPEPAQAFFGSKPFAPTPEAQRVLTVIDRLKAVQCLDRTRPLYTVTATYRAIYDRLKKERRLLDFDDQIETVRDLLTRSDVKEWVQYKLDGGIHHILLDEAQDTAPIQWEIINALKDNFTSEKTFFAVGDEKQSIYSFQGARPEKFIDEFAGHTGRENYRVKRMSMSFRSCEEVLRVADAVFEDQGGKSRMFNPAVAEKMPDSVAHYAHRSDHGQVDFWPHAPFPEDSAEETPWDTTPVDQLSLTSSKEQLAAAIARTIGKWIIEGEPIYDREARATRPIRAGDVLILVKKRDAFFDAVIRNLKSASVPVAGADRLKLHEAVIVRDMLALTRVMLLPSDDLSLAEVLKGPLFDFNEDQLFAVAHQRAGRSLWSVLADRSPEGAAAKETLTDMMRDSRRFAPYEFYARVLDRTDRNGRSGYARFYNRLGLEAQESLEAFLASTLAHQRRGAPSLQHFLHDFMQSDGELKRETENSADEVRVMTVHGSKGLEAPVVFLPDTTSAPNTKLFMGLLPAGDNYFAAGNSDQRPKALDAVKEAADARTREEAMRLLYVAMTRAESRLVVCGYSAGHRNGKGYSDTSWYSEVGAAMKDLDTRPCETPFGDGLSYGLGADMATAGRKVSRTPVFDLPPWMQTPAPKDTRSRQHVSPSHLSPLTDPPVRSPLGATQDRFRRGNIIHKLLEILPDVAPSERDAVARTYADAHKDLPEAMRDAMIREVFAVLDNPDFAEIFAPGSRAEVSLVGQVDSLPEGWVLNAQIDRLAVTDDAVYVIDYKSNRPPPKTQSGVSETYLVQMAAYRDMVRALYPDRAVHCGLLWTDSPRLMMLDDSRLDAALTAVQAVPISGQ